MALNNIGSILGSIFTGSPYTLGELMNIDADRQNRAAQCSVELLGTYHELKRETLLDKFKSLFSRNVVVMYYVIFKLKVTSPTGQHIVIIRLNPDFDLQDWADNKVKVYCDCPDFKYRSAYQLERRGSLFSNDKIRTYLGEALSVAPKKGAKTTLLCKHAFAALAWLINNYSGLMKTI